MDIREVYKAQAIAAIHTEVASNKKPYLFSLCFSKSAEMAEIKLSRY